MRARTTQLHCCQIPDPLQECGIIHVYYFKLLSFGKGQVSIIHEQKCKYPKQNISELDPEMLKERKEIMMKSDVFQIGKAESTLESILGKFTMLTA